MHRPQGRQRRQPNLQSASIYRRDAARLRGVRASDRHDHRSETGQCRLAAAALIMVDPQPELIRSRVPLFCFARQPATQVLSASTFINQNAFYAPLVQIVPPEVTNAQAKG